MRTKSEIKVEIAALELDAATLRKYGDLEGARMAQREIRRLQRKLERLE